MKTLIAVVLAALLLPGCSDTLFKAGIDMERRRAKMVEKSEDVNDLHFSYLEGGAGDTILLVHGFGANKDSWNRFARYLTDKFNVVAVDLPGHGDSTSRLEDRYDILTQAGRLALLVEKLGMDRLHIVGSSMGGAIAIYYVHQHPDQVMSLGLISSAGVLSPNPSEYMQKLDEGQNPLLVRSKEDFDHMLEFVMVNPPYMPWFIKDVTYEDYLERQAINQKIFDDISSEDMIEIPFLPQISVPVFILWGRQDRVLDVSSVAVFEKRIPDTHYVILENTGHAPMFEAPEISAGHYLQFLDALAVGSPN